MNIINHLPDDQKKGLVEAYRDLKKLPDVDRKTLNKAQAAIAGSFAKFNINFDQAQQLLKELLKLNTDLEQYASKPLISEVN